METNATRFVLKKDNFNAAGAVPVFSGDALGPCCSAAEAVDLQHHHIVQTQQERGGSSRRLFEVLKFA